jgi:hypothetical protein
MLRRHPHLAALAGYLLLSTAATWPLAARFTVDIGGDRGDAWQTLWGFWWFHDTLARGASPFACDALRWPWGVPLWLQTWDLPAAVAVFPLWSLAPRLPEVALYNLPLFASYPIAGFTAYLLCRELWGGYLGPFLAGALYTVSAYHFGHALGHLHIVSMEWSPLYFLGLVRTVRRRGLGGPALAGAALALAAGASLYHFAFCLAGSAVLLAAWLAADRQALATTALARRFALLAAVFLALAGPYLFAVVRAARAEPYAGAHDAVRYSADLLSFFTPNAASAWREHFVGWRRWTGNDAESAAYIGYAALGLAAAALWRARAARPWILVALLGFALALGPRLHVGGRVEGPELPYAWLERAVPGLAWSGVPTRFSWLVTFGVVMAAGASLSALVRSGRRGAIAACGVAALGLAESWPHPFTTSRWPEPRFLRDLAADAERWAVLDATAPTRQLWHQVLHRHPQVGGYVTRAPERLEQLLTKTPVLRPFFGAGGRMPPRGEAVRDLQAMRVRFVIVEASRLGPATALGLPRAFEGDGIWVFEVPPPSPDAGDARPPARPPGRAGGQRGL